MSVIFRFRLWSSTQTIKAISTHNCICGNSNMTKRQLMQKQIYEEEKFWVLICPLPHIIKEAVDLNQLGERNDKVPN